MMTIASRNIPQCNFKIAMEFTSLHSYSWKPISWIFNTIEFIVGTRARMSKGMYVLLQPCGFSMLLKNLVDQVGGIACTLTKGVNIHYLTSLYFRSIPTFSLHANSHISINIVQDGD